MRFLALVVLLLSGPAQGQTPGVQETQQAVRQIETAHEALKSARKAKSRLKALGRAIRAYEDGLAAMRAGLRLASWRKVALEDQLSEQRQEIADLLGVLQQIERAPTPLLLAHPGGPVGAARAANTMAFIMPELQARAETLRLDLHELQSLAKVQALAEAHMRDGLTELQLARSSLSEALIRRRKLPTRLGADAGKLAKLAENTENLTQFAKALGALDPVDGAAQMVSFASAKGNLAPPVAGVLHRGYGEPDAAGLARPGVILSAPPLSIVTSPWGATLRYVGALLDYGTVAILEPQPGYLMVLAGLGEVVVNEGAVIARGDPIGLLKGEQPSADEFLIDVTSGKSFIRNESLYIELRQDGIPIDPTPWFVLDLDEKGSR